MLLLHLIFTAFPEDGPRIEGLRSWYSVGDYLEANCTAKMTFPAAQVSWLINDIEVRCLFPQTFVVLFAGKKK